MPPTKVSLLSNTGHSLPPLLHSVWATIPYSISASVMCPCWSQTLWLTVVLRFDMLVLIESQIAVQCGTCSSWLSVDFICQ
jgi:hypothetical protein